MRIIAAVAFSAAVLIAPALAVAQEGAAAAAPAATASPAAPAAPAAADSNGVNLDEVVCKQTPPPTGSRLGGGRECHTVRQWNQMQLDSQSSLSHLQHSGSREAKGG
jgi:hypothetical protein